MVLGIQVVGLLFGAAVLYVTFLNYKRREFTLNEFGLWSVVAIALSVIALFPGLLEPIVESLNLTRALDLLVILGFIFLITAVLYIYTVARRTQRLIEEIVRKIALDSKTRRKK